MKDIVYNLVSTKLCGYRINQLIFTGEQIECTYILVQFHKMIPLSNQEHKIVISLIW